MRHLIRSQLYNIYIKIKNKGRHANMFEKYTQELINNTAQMFKLYYGLWHGRNFRIEPFYVRVCVLKSILLFSVRCRPPID